MNMMTNKDYVSGLKSNMHAIFDSSAGKEVMAFLENTCCWRASVWHPSSPDMTLINDGKRQVLSTIKTILELGPDQIIALAEKSEGG